MFKKINLFFIALFFSRILYAESGLSGILHFITTDPLNMVTEITQDGDFLQGTTYGVLLLIPGTNTSLSVFAQVKKVDKNAVANILLQDIEVFRSEEVISDYLSDAISVIDNNNGSFEDELIYLSEWAYHLLNQ